MTFLKQEEIIKAAASVQGGRMVRIGYRTEVPLRAEFKKSGMKAYKISETTVRLGVNYEKIHSVQVAKALGDLSGSFNKTSHWLIPNRVLVHNENNTHYLSVATIPNAATKTKFIIEEVNGREVEVDKNYLIPLATKAFNSLSGSKPAKYNIRFENLYRIGSVGNSAF
jgi:hypothetical protein